jgi:glutamine amidotransferase
MPSESLRRIAIVDYGLGNLYSVKHACAHVGLHATITASPQDILSADAVILPGVGAFPDAMSTLISLDLAPVIRDVAASGRPLVGICLGMQLLMTESEEFGRHEGLGIIPGRVVRLPDARASDPSTKVPQIGWTGVERVARETSDDPWAGSLLEGLADGTPMYFVHSYIVRPDDPAAILSTSRYTGDPFCSALQRGNVIACQFHPERSGEAGLRMYRTLARQLAFAQEGVTQ